MSCLWSFLDIANFTCIIIFHKLCYKIGSRELVKVEDEKSCHGRNVS